MAVMDFDGERDDADHDAAATVAGGGLRRVAAEHERSVSAELRFLVRRHVVESAA